MSDLKSFLSTNQLVVRSIQRIRNNSVKGRNGLFLLSATSLAACGGAGGGGISPPPPPPPPTNGFTQSGDTFTGTDQTETLSQGSATANLTVDAKNGNDNITTGSGADIIDGGPGNDTINSGAGNDMIRGGKGTDTIDAGAGDDIIIVVGSTDANQYGQADITNPAGTGVDLSALLTLATLNGQTTDEANSNEVIDGGTGNNTLYVYGTVDFTNVTISNVTQVVVNSDVKFNDDQLGAGKITKITGDGGSTIRIESNDGAAVTVDIANLEIDGVHRVEVGVNVTLVISSAADLKNSGITVITGTGTVKVVGQGANVDLTGIVIENSVKISDDQGAEVEHGTTGATVVSPQQVDDSEHEEDGDDDDGTGEDDHSPHDLRLDEDFDLDENDAGAIAGSISLQDNDLDDVHTFLVDDERFEVIEGKLKLKDGISLDYETEQSISVIVTASDLAGNSVTQTFVIEVEDVLEGVVIKGIAASDNIGRSLSSGDFNGDGISDILIGSYGANDNAGASYVVFGNANGLPTSLDLADLDGTNGFVMTAADVWGRAGISVDNAGDINGDGIDDIIIGAPYTTIGGVENVGKVYVVYGDTSGFDANIDLSALDGTNGFVLEGNGDRLFFGKSVAGAGDINGDGIDDFIIGEPLMHSGSYGDNDPLASGMTYVVFGNASGFGASFDVTTLDGSNGFSILGEGTFDNFGTSVSGAGDLNGDGIDDIVISGLERGDGSSVNNYYIIFGSTDAFDASFDLSSLDGTNGFKMIGSSRDSFNGRDVSNAGDVNGDGIDDLIVGSRGFDSVDAENVGESYVVFGSNQGFSATLDLATLDGTNGFIIKGIDAGDQSGNQVSAAGDINGDGIDDFIVSTYFQTPAEGEPEAGESYVIFGRSDGFGATLNLADLDEGEGFVLKGVDSNDNGGYGVSAAGDVNGDGVDDLLVSAINADTGDLANTGEVYIIYGHTAPWDDSYELEDLLLDDDDQSPSGTITQVNMVAEPTLFEDDMLFNTLGDGGTLHYDYG